MKILVLSGINFYEGGPLSIYYDILDALLLNNVNREYEIIAFVHKRELFNKYKKSVTIIELPKSRKSYIYRLYYEYLYFYNFSKKKNIDIWISLHDITPHVKAKKIYTYCHNPTPFMKADLSKFKYSWKLFLFSLFYRYLYRINIKANEAVIVQQCWMRDKFLKMYPIRKVIVARPTLKEENVIPKKTRCDNKIVFVYAAYPRYFKNYEIILELARRIKNEKFELWITLNGNENNYARDLWTRYGELTNVKWLGLLNRAQLFNVYGESDYLIFPSKIETWGLPISEYKGSNKPIFLADLPYAREAIGTYSSVIFFDPNDIDKLYETIEHGLVDGFDFQKVNEKIPASPFAEDWDELLKMIFLK